MTQPDVTTSTTDVKSEEDLKYRAYASLRSDVNATYVIDAFSGRYQGRHDMFALTEVLSEIIDRVQSGNLRRCESMLIGQAMGLQSIFTNLSAQAAKREGTMQMEILLRLALKAQNQCRMTLETLVNIKNPPVVYAKQANIAAGHQQVNNGVMTSSTETSTSSNAPEKTFSSNELLSESNNASMDIERTAKTSTINSPVETMAAVQRT